MRHLQRSGRKRPTGQNFTGLGVHTHSICCCEVFSRFSNSVSRLDVSQIHFWAMWHGSDMFIVLAVYCHKRWWSSSSWSWPHTSRMPRANCCSSLSQAASLLLLLYDLPITDLQSAKSSWTSTLRTPKLLMQVLTFPPSHALFQKWIWQCPMQDRQHPHSAKMCVQTALAIHQRHQQEHIRAHAQNKLQLRAIPLQGMSGQKELEPVMLVNLAENAKPNVTVNDLPAGGACTQALHATTDTVKAGKSASMKFHSPSSLKSLILW